MLINRLVYASEGLRGALAPQVPHMSTLAILGALVVIDVVLMVGGLKKLESRALG